MSQKILVGVAYDKIREEILSLGSEKFMLVCGSSLSRLELGKYLNSLDIPHIVFSGFSPNPKYEEICPAVELFLSEGCDLIVAVGGGSAIDVAKCIKVFSKMDQGRNYLEQGYPETDIPLIAIPTTAGTGSESTKYSVIYYNGEKQSVTDDILVPNIAVLFPEMLYSLPEFQKKCTLLDALCQAIESFWSVRSTDESRLIAKKAIELIVANADAYIFDNDADAADKIMQGSNLAGQAINITATTAPHAMSYKLTTIYGFPHGYSVALSLPRVWRYMIGHGEKCSDKRGFEFLCNIFEDIAKAMGYESADQAICGFEAMLDRYGITGPEAKDRRLELETLVGAVNVERLGNNPVALDTDVLTELYGEILR